MGLRSRLLLTTSQQEEMEVGDEIKCDEIARIAEQSLAPPAAPALHQVDLRALAAQLPDMTQLDHFTVNIQSNNNTFLQ